MSSVSILRATLAATLLALAGTAPLASAQTDLAEAACRRNAMPACRTLGEAVTFSLNSGRGGVAVGSADPLWTVNNAVAHTVTHPSWQANGGATWISPSTTGTANAAGGNHTYAAQVWFDQDPYLYDGVQLDLSVGGDNTVVSVSVNGTIVHTGNGGNQDFRTANFDQVSHTDAANWPWVRGCNRVVVTIANSSGPSGATMRGEVRARCSRCVTPRPAPRAPATP